MCGRWSRSASVRRPDLEASPAVLAALPGRPKPDCAADHQEGAARRGGRLPSAGRGRQSAEPREGGRELAVVAPTTRSCSSAGTSRRGTSSVALRA